MSGSVAEMEGNMTIVRQPVNVRHTIYKILNTTTASDTHQIVEIIIYMLRGLDRQDIDNVLHEVLPTYVAQVRADHAGLSARNGHRSPGPEVPQRSRGSADNPRPHRPTAAPPSNGSSSPSPRWERARNEAFESLPAILKMRRRGKDETKSVFEFDIDDVEHVLVAAMKARNQYQAKVERWDRLLREMNERGVTQVKDLPVEIVEDILGQELDEEVVG